MDIQPLHDWLVVRFEPLDKRSSILELPGQNESAVRKGVVVTVGTGRRNKNGDRIPLGIEPGEKVVFLRWHQEHRPGKAVSESLARKSEELGADLCMVRLNDILFVYTDDVRVDI